MVLKAASFGALAAVIALGIAGPSPALAALAGGLAAGAYAAGYLRSHIFRSTAVPRFFDSKVAGHFVLRAAAVALIGWLAFEVGGKPSLRAYLLTFAVAFPVLLMTEMPRAVRQLRARGLMG